VLDPSDLESRYLLLEIYSGRKDWQRLAQTATEVTDLLPEDPSARRYLALGESRLARAAAAERAAANQPTAENYAALAAVYEDDGQHAAAIHAAERALELRPGYAEAARTLAEAERQVPLR
jgi:tetratricopeptide (TPR) repeat protein